MRILGVSLVRDEEDIVALNLLFHLSLGLDEILVVDNGSNDATPQILRKLARRTGKVKWTREDGPYRQPELTTGLAQEAARRGATWVMAIDADEFWYPAGNLHAILADVQASIVMVEIVNFVQRRSQRTRSADALLHMTRRVAEPVGPVAQTRSMVESRAIAFVEMEYPPKCIARASPTMQIHAGNHRVTGIEESVHETTSVQCLHAPLRAYEVLEGKVKQGERVEASGSFPPTGGWHVRRWKRLAENEELESEWRANSYEDSALDVFGRPARLVIDHRLRDAIEPFVEPSLAVSRSRRYFDLSRLRMRL